MQGLLLVIALAGNFFWDANAEGRGLTVCMGPYIDTGVSCENTIYWNKGLFNGPIHDV